MGPPATLWRNDETSFKSTLYKKKAVASMVLRLAAPLYNDTNRITLPTAFQHQNYKKTLIPHGTAVILVKANTNLFTGSECASGVRGRRVQTKQQQLNTACYFNMREYLPQYTGVDKNKKIHKDSVVAVYILAGAHVCEFNYNKTETMSLTTMGDTQVAIPSDNPPLAAKASSTIYWRLNKNGSIHYTLDSSFPSVCLGVLKLNLYHDNPHMFVTIRP